MSLFYCFRAQLRVSCVLPNRVPPFLGISLSHAQFLGLEKRRNISNKWTTKPGDQLLWSRSFSRTLVTRENNKIIVDLFLGGDKAGRGSGGLSSEREEVTPLA